MQRSKLSTSSLRSPESIDGLFKIIGKKQESEDPVSETRKSRERKEDPNWQFEHWHSSFVKRLNLRVFRVVRKNREV